MSDVDANTTTDEAPSFAVWDLRTRIDLAKRGVNRRHADVAIEQAEEYCAETGQSAFEVFGPADTFAELVANEVGQYRSAIAEDDEGTVRDRLSVSAIVVLGNALAWSCVIAVATTSLTWTATPTRLIQLALLATAIVLMTIPGGLRTAGRPRLAKAAYALPLAAVLGAIVAQFAPLSTRALFTVPHLLVAATAGVAILAVVLTWRGDTVPEPTDDEVRRLHDLVHRLAGAPDADPDRWFRRLHGLLVSRHTMSTQRAAFLVDEARAHLADTGTAAEDEFGPVGTYAADIAAPTRTTPRPWYRSNLTLAVALHLATLILIARLCYNVIGQHWIEVPLDLALITVVILIRLRLAGRRRTTAPPAEPTPR